jgi:hypothetical protein
MVLGMINPPVGEIRLTFNKDRYTNCGECFPGADFLLETSTPNEPFNSEISVVIGVKSAIDTKQPGIGVFSMTRQALAQKAVADCQEDALTMEYVGPVQ